MSRKIGVILSLIAIVFEAVSTLVLTPLLIRSVGGSDYGIYKLCVGIIAYVMLLDLGVGNSIVRFVSKYRFENDRENMKKFMGTTSIFYASIAALSIIFGIVVFFLFPYVFGKGLSSSEIVLGQKLVLINAAASAVILGTTGFANAIIAYEKFYIVRGLAILQTIFKLILTFIVLKLGWGVIAASLVYLIVTVITRILYVLYALIRLKMPIGLKGIRFAFIKEIVIYSGLITIQMVATQLNQSLDQIFIGAFVANSSSLLGVYAIGAQVNQYFMSIGTGVTGILMPSIVRMITNNEDKEKLKAELSKLSRIIFYLLGVIFFGFAVFGKQFIILWTGVENLDAYYVALLLMAGQVMIIPLSPLTQLLWAKNKNVELSIAKLSVVVMNSFLTIALLKIHPLFGVAVGTFISILVGDVVVLLTIIKAKENITVVDYLFDSFGNTLLCYVFVSIAFFGIMKLLNFNVGWLSFVISVGCFSFISLALLMVFAFTDYERTMIRQIFHRKERGIAK